MKYLELFQALWWELFFFSWAMTFWLTMPFWITWAFDKIF